ncbi:MAG: NADPH:quinone reductase [Nakamurella sp.]
MRAIVYTATGDPSVLKLVDREVPTPGPGEVRIKVAVSAVNPTDWKSRAGSGAGGDLPFPEIVPNLDGAGVIDAVGAGVDGLAVGDRVWTYLAAHQRPTGTAQEFTVLPAARAVKLPDPASFDQGASMGVPALTAHRALTVNETGPSRLHPGALTGKTVLVAGGAGAVGHAAIQLARWAGATVITTISSDAKANLAAAAGAHHTVNYRDQDAAAVIGALAPDGVDIIVEVSPAQNATLNLAVAANHASVSVYANNGGDEVGLAIIAHFVKNIRYQFVLLYTVGQDALDAGIADVTAALADGALPVGEAAGLPLVRFPLADSAGAHAAVENNTVGKVLIDVSRD